MSNNTIFSKIPIRSILQVFITLLVLSLFINFAYAEVATTDIGGQLEGKLCGLVAIVMSGPVKIAATVAVMAGGFGALMGKIQWPVLLTTGTGIVLLFMAPVVVDQISGKEGNSIAECIKTAAANKGA